MFNIAIAADHAGFTCKEYIKSYCKKNPDYILEDCGANSATVSVDYPVFAKLVVNKLLTGESDFGILVCASGIGMSIVANRYKNIRAALCYNQEAAYLSRIHNNANILVLSEKFLTDNMVTQKIIDTFLTTTFDNSAGNRHNDRINMIDD